MKFVGDRLTLSRPSDDGRRHTVRIPIYHRAAVGVFPGTQLFAVPLTATNEIVLTPINPLMWGDLWRLEATVSDKPGSAKAIVETLVANNVNVLVHEGVSESTERGKAIHHVFEILDLAKYVDKRDGTSEWRNSVNKPLLKPNRLINNLIANAEHCLELARGETEWELHLSRMEFFHRNKDTRPDTVGLRLNVNHEVHIPDGVFSDMPLVEDLAEPIALHIISDTEQKYVKLRVLSPNKFYLLVEIEHAERVGAIDEFMEVLREHRANMIDSYSRLKSVTNTASFYAFAEFSRRMTAPKVQAIIEDLVASPPAREVRLKGAFGNGPSLTKLKLPGAATIRIGSPPQVDAMSQDTAFMPAGEDGVAPKAGARDQLGQPYYLKHPDGASWPLNRADVFMAIPFTDEYEDFYEDVIVPAVREAGLEPIRADRLRPQRIRRHIMDLIEEGIARSRFVIADVSGWNPNVVYEVGLAVGITKPILALCDSSDFDALPFDFRSYQLIKYSPDRRRKLRDQLRVMIEEMKEETDGGRGRAIIEGSPAS